MNRQNNLKIIITTIIVLVISTMAVFTVVNWSEIVKKFQGAAAKADGIEKHERNTVPPANGNTVASTKTKEEWKESEPAKEENKLIPNSPTEQNSRNLPKLDDTVKPDSKLKEADPYGLDEPPTLKPKDSIKPSPFTIKDNEEYPMGNENYAEKKKPIAYEKSLPSNKVKMEFPKKKSRKTFRKSKSRVNVNKLDKRVRFLEKQLGVKKSSSNKNASLDKRIYRLEKIISKKKK